MCHYNSSNCPVLNSKRLSKMTISCPLPLTIVFTIHCLQFHVSRNPRWHISRGLVLKCFNPRSTFRPIQEASQTHFTYPAFGPKFSITPVARLNIYIFFFTRTIFCRSLVMTSYGYAVQTRIAASDEKFAGD